MRILIEFYRILTNFCGNSVPICLNVVWSVLMLFKRVRNSYTSDLYAYNGPLSSPCYKRSCARTTKNYQILILEKFSKEILWEFLQCSQNLSEKFRTPRFLEHHLKTMIHDSYTSIIYYLLIFIQNFCFYRQLFLLH